MESISFLNLEDSSYRNIWRVSWPVMISRLSYTLLTTVDLFWIGKLGPSAVAAVGVVGSIYWVLFSFMGLITAPTIAITSRAAGMENKNLMRRGISFSLLLSLILSLSLMIPSTLFTENILSIFGLNPEVEFQGIIYMKILLTGIVFLIPQESIISIFYGLGDSRMPMLISVISTIFNVILDPLLIFGWGIFPKMGIGGAALASVISILLGLIISIMIFMRKVGVKKFMFNYSTAKSFLKIGFPAMLQMLTRPVTGMLMYRIAALFGTFAVAGFSIGSRIINFVFIYMDGFIIATQTLVGQHLGSGNRKRATEVVFRTLKLGLIIQIIFAAVIVFFSGEIVALFNPVKSVVAQGSSYLIIITLSLIIYPLAASFGAAHRGSGDTRPLTISAIIANWLIKIPLSLFLSRNLNFGSSGVWLAIGISVIAETIIISWFYFRKGWIDYEIAH